MKGSCAGESSVGKVRRRRVMVTPLAPLADFRGPVVIGV